MFKEIDNVGMKIISIDKEKSIDVIFREYETKSGKGLTIDIIHLGEIKYEMFKKDNNFFVFKVNNGKYKLLKHLKMENDNITNIVMNYVNDLLGYMENPNNIALIPYVISSSI